MNFRRLVMHNLVAVVNVVQYKMDVNKQENIKNRVQTENPVLAD